MSRKKVMLVFGTRPEAIKMAPLYSALAARPTAFDVVVCVTAQHRGMLDQVLQDFGIVADFDLDLMRGGQELTELHAAVLSAMRAVLGKAKPDIVLVHGDTTTTLAAALAAFYAGIAVGHVEAGLRSGRLDAPYPEELNRRIVDMIAHWHFAPTDFSREHLLREGCDPERVSRVGNTVVDALLATVKRLKIDREWHAAVASRVERAVGFDVRATRYVVVTSHRRENAAHSLEGICSAIRALAQTHPAVRFVFPVHPNPAVRQVVTQRLSGRPGIHLIDPQPYSEFVHLLRHCHSVLTDSGGLQEECVVLDKPVLVMRAVTERPEVVSSGGARLVGTDTTEIVAAMSALLTDDVIYESLASAHNPFGDGSAAERIADLLQAG